MVCEVRASIYFAVIHANVLVHMFTLFLQSCRYSRDLGGVSSKLNIANGSCLLAVFFSERVEFLQPPVYLLKWHKIYSGKHTG